MGLLWWKSSLIAAVAVILFSPFHETHQFAVATSANATTTTNKRVSSFGQPSIPAVYFGMSGETTQELASLHQGKNEFVPIQEIEYVQIVEDPLSRSPWLSRPDNYYVVFYQDKHGKSKRSLGKSMPLSNFAKDCWVNLPIEATKKALRAPLFCEVKEKRRFIPDKTHFTAEVNLTEIEDDSHDETTAPLVDSKGRVTTAKIKLRFFATKWVKGSEGRKRGNNRIRPSLFYRAFSLMFKKQIDSFSTTICDVQKPTDPANEKLDVGTIFGITHPKEDEFIPITMLEHLFYNFLLLLPDSNRNNIVTDRALLRNEIRTKTLLGNVVSPAEGHWHKPLSDESMSRFFFSHVGMFLVERVSDDGGYAADMTAFSTLEYKEGLQNLGCKVFFDVHSNITSIQSFDGATYYPNDKSWGWAKLLARTSAFILVSIQHLMFYHLRWGNIPALTMRKYLPPNHPIRQSLGCHFFRTHHTVATVEYNLVSKKSVLGRGLPFEYNNGYTVILNQTAQNYTFETYPDELVRRGLKDSDYHIGANDGLRLHEILVNYVSDLFDEIYPTDGHFQQDTAFKKSFEYMTDDKNLKGAPKDYSLSNAKEMWGEILFRVTGMHYAVGNAAVEALEPFMVNFRMRAGDREVNGSWETIIGVSVISGITMPNEYPLISDDWSRLLHTRRSKAFIQLQSDLRMLAGKIDAENKSRRFKNKDFHPHVAAISVTA